MKVKIEIEIDIEVDETSGYIDSLTQEIVSKVHERTGLKKNLVFISDFDIIKFEIL